MYRKQDKAQFTMDEFNIPFGDGLDANNRWVRTAKFIPWDFIEEQYAKSFSEEKGRPSINSRIALGAESRVSDKTTFPTNLLKNLRKSN